MPAVSTLTYPIRSDKYTMTVKVREHLCHVQSPFQTIDIYDTEAFGKMLFLDGHVQLAGLDEHAYHESLVHVPLLSVPNPKRAMVIGGGDGGVLRELVKHSSLERIDMIDIDAQVIETSRSYLPELSDHAFENPKVNLVIGDAFEFIKSAEGPYDLMVLDVTDTYEDEDGALSENIFTESFYRDCFNLLSESGFAVSQADNHVFCPYSMVAAMDAFKAVFPTVGSYQALVPSFGGFSGYVWASKGAKVADTLPNSASHLNLRYLNSLTYALAIQGGAPGGLFPPF